MSKSLKFLFKQKNYGSVKTGIGTLYIYYLSIKDYEDIKNNLDCDLENANTEDFLNEFIKHISFPEDTLEDKAYKPKEIALDDKDVSAIDQSDIDKIIELYIENNPYLNKKKVEKSERDDEGVVRVFYSYEDIIHPKNSDESLGEYLHRLIVLNDKKHKEQQKKITESIIGKSNFSHGLDKSIMSTLSLGESLTKLTSQIYSPLGEAFKAYKSPFPDSLDQINKIIAPTENLFKGIEPIPAIDHGKKIREMYKAEKEEREHLFKELYRKLDELVELTSESTKFMVEMNKSQTQMANELKQSGDQASKHSKINIYISMAVIFLTVIGLLISSFSVYVSLNDKNTVSLGKSINSLTENIKTLPSTTDISRLESKINQQSRKIEDLKAENQSQKKEMISLKSKLQEISTVQPVPKSASRRSLTSSALK